MFTGMDESGSITDVDVAVTWLLHAVGEEATGDPTADLVTACHATLRVRELNTAAGGLVLDALHTMLDSWRAVERETGIKVATARRWAVPPPS